jgi:alcohol dehydrogenase (cytochrome c)
VPGPGERFADTWEGESYKWGGAGVWTHVALDPDLGMLYFGTGYAGPDNDGSRRGGDSLFTSSIGPRAPNGESGVPDTGERCGVRGPGC